MKSDGGKMAEALSLPVTVAVLFYGDHAPLMRRFIGALASTIEPGQIRLRVGLNAVGEESRMSLEEMLPPLRPELVIDSPENLYKAKMMRRLFTDLPIRSGWTIWFDDDSFVFRRDWLGMLQHASRSRPEVDMWGSKMFIRTWPELEDFVHESPWHRGKGLEPDPESGSRINFIAGGFWAVRSEWITRLIWPDRRLTHFGDDYLLGEALRQNGGILGNFFSGVAVNRSLRRAPRDTPRSAAMY